VRWIEKVLEVALERQPVPVVDVPAVPVAAATTTDAQGDVVKH
jgi:ATP-dependent Lon protease